jgi:hypothetical protein
MADGIFYFFDGFRPFSYLPYLDFKPTLPSDGIAQPHWNIAGTHGPPPR